MDWQRGLHGIGQAQVFKEDRKERRLKIVLQLADFGTGEIVDSSVNMTTGNQDFPGRSRCNSFSFLVELVGSPPAHRASRALSAVGIRITHRRNLHILPHFGQRMCSRSNLIISAGGILHPHSGHEVEIDALWGLLDFGGLPKQYRELLWTAPVRISCWCLHC